jgi:DNA-binding GntR family transcriptional regulator
MNRPKTIREYVYEQLKNKILIGEYQPGDRMIETNLAQDLDVSRTPIREALNQLEAEGLLETEPHRGIFVKKLSMKNIQDFYQTRAVLEGLAAKLAVENASEEELSNFKALLDRMEVLFSRDKEIFDFKELAETNNEFHKTICFMSKNEVVTKMLDGLQNPIALIRSTAWANNSERKYNTLIEHRNIALAIIKRDGKAAQENAEMHIYNAWKAASQALDERKVFE